MMYKYRIYDRSGNWIDHCDPYGYGMELRPGTASVIRDLGAYQFCDVEWMKNRSDCRHRPAEYIRKSISALFASLPKSRTTGMIMKRWRIS